MTPGVLIKLNWVGELSQRTMWPESRISSVLSLSVRHGPLWIKCWSRWIKTPGLLKRLQIRAQATLASGIGSLESIPGLLKRLQIWAQATLASGIGSLESIPGLRKHLQIRAQATLASGIGSLKSIPRLHSMKNNDNFFGSKRIYLSLNYQRDEEY
jgi:hypothetical protein